MQGRGTSRFSRAPSASRGAVVPPRNNGLSRTGLLASVASGEESKIVTEPAYEYSNKIIHPRKELDSFANLLIHQNTREIDVSGNLLTDFNGLPSLRHLETLNVSKNKILSFQGFPHFTHLTNINVTGNPVAKNEYHRIALLIICPSLKVINGEYVRPNELSIVKTYPRECSELLRAGWQLKYPPPKQSDIPKLKKEIAKSVAARRDPVKVSAAPTVMHRPKKQSVVYKEMLAKQEAEMRAITQQIEKITGK